MAKPEIRIKGFNDDWEDRPFCKIASRVSTSGNTKELPGVEFEDIVSGEGVLNKDVNAKKINKIGKVFEEGDVLFGKLRPYLKNILLADFKGIAIGDFWVLRPNDINPDFLYLLVSSGTFMKVANISSGSKMPRADWNLVSDSHFFIPKDRTEQLCFSDYFKFLDSTIQGLTNKVALLRQLKQACLVSMFPQEGETVPRVRFKGFTEEWSRKSFGDLYYHNTIKNDMTYSTDRIISVANMYFISKPIISSEDYLKTYNIFQLGDIAFEGNKSKNFAHGRFVENTIGNGIVSHVFEVFTPTNDNYDLNYWKYAINNERIMRNVLVRCTKASTMMTNLVAKDFLKEYTLVPSYEEQRKIGSLLAGIDNQIVLCERRLEKLKQIKSACLDKMFV